MDLPDDIAMNILRCAQANGEIRFVQVIDDSPTGESVPSHEIHVIKTREVRSLGCVNTQFARLQRPVLRRIVRQAYEGNVLLTQPPTEHLVFVEIKN